LQLYQTHVYNVQATALKTRSLPGGNATPQLLHLVCALGVDNTRNN